MTDTCRTLTIPAESRTYTVDGLTGGTISVAVGSEIYWGTSYWGGGYWGVGYWGAAGSIAVTASPNERVLVINAENRELDIMAEDRTFIVRCP